MQVADFKTALQDLGLSQADFARLVGVTSRAVALWTAAERSIPGPIESYLRLLQSAPTSVRQAEFNRLKERSNQMREGMYGVEYAGQAGRGAGAFVLQEGRIYGADPFGGRYDGDYTYDEATGLADLRLKLTFAPNAKAVFGISNPYEWSVDATAQIDSRAGSGTTQLRTALGPTVQIAYSFMRGLPEA